MTTIEWTDRTWNPTTGCNKVSPGCKNCYAEVMHKRQQAMNPHKYTRNFSAGVQAHEDELAKPLRWKKPARIFVNSMSDLFHDDVQIEFLDNVFVMMMECKQHTFQILTKRPQRMLEVINKFFPNALQPPKNVWLGISAEDQPRYDDRIEFLKELRIKNPWVTTFISAEPLLGPIDLMLLDREYKGVVNWVIAGGESGPKARPMHPDWARSLRDQCEAASVPFFFKQWGEFLPSTETKPLYKNTYIGWLEKDNIAAYRVGKKKAGRTLDGVIHNQFPETSKLQLA